MDERAELLRLRELLLFQERLDEFLESAGSRRLSLEAALGEVLPLIARQLGAEQVWLETYDEALRMRSFAVGADGQPCATEIPLPERARSLVSGRRLAAGGDLVACTLDVAGEAFGVVAARVPEPGKRERQLLRAAAELLDNYLAAIRDARVKQRLLRAIHRDLSHPVLHEGVSAAVGRIMDTVRFDLLLVIYHFEDDLHDTLHYLVFRGPELEFDSRTTVAEALDSVLRRQGLREVPGAEELLRGAETEHRRVCGEDLPNLATGGGSEELLELLGYRECLETVLIAGLDARHPVGKLVVGSRRPLSTYERDVFELFSDALQKRVVDFNKAGKLLRRTFSAPVVLRLLEDPERESRLAPRAENDVSILYADLAGFTRLSERILRDPARVACFVEAWARGAIEALWREGGCFDKLVGDCVIGLFGPPFYDRSPTERALACVRAAVAISEFTNAMVESSQEAADLRAANEVLGVAVGLNHCPASVGRFGLDQDFTAFAPGMNNAARLQSLAARDEILVMEPMKRLLEAAEPRLRFGALREAKVKNVAEPLRFYALERDSVPME
ncbi:MAG: adenylate/guanylate cyclase domain-containing protein [Planctomycetota bacterium]|nr:MAG: adenylate/guanylate cyclase domain-containing protein [Planctomycetota bacterium]